MAQIDEDEMEQNITALRKILSETVSMKPQESFEGIDARLDYNEVYPNIFMSDGKTAKNKEFLKKIGVTRILNAGQGGSLWSVETNTEYYQDTGIEFLGFHLADVEGESSTMSSYFQQAAEYIDEGLKSGGKVLVHCYCGISRSSTLVLAYLLLKKNMSIEDALREMKMRRWIWPNNGFLGELIKLDRRLRFNS